MGSTHQPPATSGRCAWPRRQGTRTGSPSGRHARSGAREQRHRRRMDWITAPIEVARTAAVLVLWLAGGLLGLGAVLAVAHSDLTWVLAPLNTAVQTAPAPRTRRAAASCPRSG